MAIPQDELEFDTQSRIEKTTRSDFPEGRVSQWSTLNLHLGNELVLIICWTVVTNRENSFLATRFAGKAKSAK